MSNSVTTPLYIGGKERQTADTMAIADPAKPGVVVGYIRVLGGRRFAITRRQQGMESSGDFGPGNRSILIRRVL